MFFILCNHYFIQLWVVCTISKTIDFSIIFKIISTSFLSNFYIFLNKNIANGGVFFTPKLTIFYLIFYLFFSHWLKFVEMIAPKLLQNRFSKLPQPCGCKERRFCIMPFWMTTHNFYLLLIFFSIFKAFKPLSIKFTYLLYHIIYYLHKYFCK